MFDWQTILTVVAITGAISFVGLRAWQRIRSMRSRVSCVSDCHGCDAILNRDLLHHTALPLDVRRWLGPAAALLLLLRAMPVMRPLNPHCQGLVHIQGGAQISWQVSAGQSHRLTSSGKAENEITFEANQLARHPLTVAVRAAARLR